MVTGRRDGRAPLIEGVWGFQREPIGVVHTQGNLIRRSCQCDRHHLARSGGDDVLDPLVRIDDADPRGRCGAGLECDPLCRSGSGPCSGLRRRAGGHRDRAAARGVQGNLGLLTNHEPTGIGLLQHRLVCVVALGERSPGVTALDGVEGNARYRRALINSASTPNARDGHDVDLGPDEVRIPDLRVGRDHLCRVCTITARDLDQPLADVHDMLNGAARCQVRCRWDGCGRRRGW